jgi:hypothetical protein
MVRHVKRSPPKPDKPVRPTTEEPRPITLPKLKFMEKKDGA